MTNGMGNARRLTGTASPTRHHRLMEETQSWLDDIVIGQKLCPFAPPVRSAPQLRMVVPDATTTTSGDTLDELLEQISAEADLLVEGLLNQQKSMIEDSDGGDDDYDQNSADNYEYPETTLIILDTDVYPSLGREYRNLVQLSWRIQMECIVDRGHSDRLQLVLFHPLAVHDTYTERPPANDGGEQVEDCADYTIRSPHPTVHLLRQADVMRAVQGGYADLEGLPSRNKAKLRRDGIEVCRKRLEGCSVK